MATQSGTPDPDTDSLGEKIRRLHTAHADTDQVGTLTMMGLLASNPTVYGGRVSRLSGDADEPHSNPLDVSGVTDTQRAELFREYDAAIADDFPDRLYMPGEIVDGSKQPAIRGMGEGALDTDEARELLHTPTEAQQALRDGQTAFCLYLGKPDHGTEHLCVSDHDDEEAFPPDTLPDTLTVMSGSGGTHKYYRNAGGVENAHAKDDYQGGGEIKAHNVNVWVPGSIHPDGGIYHMTQTGHIATLSNEILPAGLTKRDSTRTPSDGTHDRSETDTGAIDVTLRLREEIDPDAYTTADGYSLAECCEYDEKLDDLLTTAYPGWNLYDGETVNTDDSQVEAVLVNRLYRHGFTYQAIADIWRYYRKQFRTEKPYKLNRIDYITGTLADCTTTITPLRQSDSQYVPLLPEPETNLRAHEDSLPMNEVHNKCEETVRAAFDSDEPVLIDAICGVGKSHTVVKIAAATDTPITIFTARHDLYDQYEQWADEYGLSILKLPSFHNDCDTMNGEYGEEWHQRVKEMYDDGLHPSHIHRNDQQLFGESMPCQDGHECPYKAMWDDPDEYDVIVGFYTHIYNPNLTDNRQPIIDEYPDDAFMDEYDESVVMQAVCQFCEYYDKFPFDNHTDIFATRDEMQSKATIWFDGNADELGYNEQPTITDDIHPLASVFAYGLVFAEDLGNGLETTHIDCENGHYRFVRDTGGDGISLLHIPQIDCEGIIGLDGTPGDGELWNLVFNTQFNQQQVLTDSERAEYIQHTKGMQIVRTSEKAQSYGKAKWNNPDRDAALFDELATLADEPPLITSKKVRDEYRDMGITDQLGTDEYHYNNMVGTNELSDEPVGVVCGSMHHGDDTIELWAAFDGQANERVTQPNGRDTKGMNTEHTTDIGNAKLYQMRDAQTGQALFRYGRDLDESTVYVNTATIPEWIPYMSGDVTKISDGLREIVMHMNALDTASFTTTDIATGVTLTRRSVSNHLNRLAEYGILSKESDPGQSATYYYDRPIVIDCHPTGSDVQ